MCSSIKFLHIYAVHIELYTRTSSWFRKKNDLLKNSKSSCLRQPSFEKKTYNSAKQEIQNKMAWRTRTKSSCLLVRTILIEYNGEKRDGKFSVHLCYELNARYLIDCEFEYKIYIFRSLSTNIHYSWFCLFSSKLKNYVGIKHQTYTNFEFKFTAINSV